VANHDAVISADGTTVAWISPLGALEQETRTLPGESGLTNGGSGDVQAAWRRIADGPGAATVRITGAVDALRQDCPADAVVTFNNIPAACQGPLVVDATTSGSAFSNLSLSGDGYEAVLISPAAVRGLPAKDFNIADAFLVDMHPGLTRAEATRALTDAVIPGHTASEGIAAAAISADGNTIALSTQRTRFDLTSPSYVGPPRPAPAAGNELYILDRARDTLNLVTGGFDGTLAAYPNSCSGGTLSPSLSANGSLAAFDSCANNLVWGDGNGASDVFAVSSPGGSARSGPAQQDTLALPPVSLTPLWLLRATARALASGSVELDILVPSSGGLSVAATAHVPVISAKGRRASVTRVRTVAAARASVPGGGLMALQLNLSRPYGTLARSSTGLPATVRLAFRAPGVGAPLYDTIAVTFRARQVRSSNRPPGHKSSGHKSRGHKSGGRKKRRARRR
jgi:hypothetical protein